MVETEIDGLKKKFESARMNKKTFKVEYDYEYKGKKMDRCSALKKGLIVDRVMIDRFMAIDYPIKIPKSCKK